MPKLHNQKSLFNKLLRIDYIYGEELDWIHSSHHEMQYISCGKELKVRGEKICKTKVATKTYVYGKEINF